MRIIVGLSAVLLALSTSSSFAMDPAMEMDSPMGKIMVDMKNMTLYTFDKDEKDKSNCYDKCATNWPPLMAGADAKAMGEWTVVKRTDGSMQWAYDGKPLYTFVKDKKPGDVTGDGASGVWHVVKAD
jgi:predicted lipoprotein with Yx(FWY)xxD motif